MAGRRKSTKQDPNPPDQNESGTGMLGHLTGLFEQVIDYFQTLLLYARRVALEKIKNGLIYYFLFKLFFLTLIAGTGLVLSAVYIQLYRLFNSDPVFTSLVLGISLMTISFLIILLLFKRIHRDI